MVVLPPQITSQPKDYFRTFIRELHDTTSCFGGQVLFSALVVLEGGEPVAARKGRCRSRIGLAIGLGIERRRDGTRTRETGQCNRFVAVPTKSGSVV